MKTMVEIRDLCKHFGPFTAVNNISFQVQQGEVLGFLGPNGAGKSTTMKMITGFLAPSSGSIIVGGDEISENPLAVKKRIGYLPEGAPAYPDMTPKDFLDFIASLRGFRGEKKKQKVAETIKRVNLESVLLQPIETLSKGFKRRVGLAQAIIHDPEILILDEPTDGLDPNQKNEVRTLIKNMAREKVIILSTHILEEVDAVCSRAVIIANGRVVADGTPSELKSRSAFHNCITITIKGSTLNSSDVRHKLLSIPQIEKLETIREEDSELSFLLFPVRGRSAINEVSQQAKSHGWDVTELHMEKGRLDEVFRAITT
jgi:ABC-2 type transport system ATP-binding protein